MYAYFLTSGTQLGRHFPRLQLVFAARVQSEGLPWGQNGSMFSKLLVNSTPCCVGNPGMAKPEPKGRHADLFHELQGFHK